MSFNTFGQLFRVTTFGESHGIAIGCVVDGCPPLLPLTNEDIQLDLDRRRPGQSRFTTQRQEPDAVKILSGVMAHPETGVQVTTGFGSIRSVAVAVNVTVRPAGERASTVIAAGTVSTGGWLSTRPAASADG